MIIRRTRSKLRLEMGTKKWFNSNNVLHRENGPAVIFPNGSMEYWKNGILHRKDGPAVINTIKNGVYNKEWWVNGQRHRENGPALIYRNEVKEWWIKDQRHRIDGPAIIWSSGYVVWFLENIQYNTFEKWAKKTPISDEEIAFIKLKYEGRWSEHG